MRRTGTATWHDAAVAAVVLALTVATAVANRDGAGPPLVPWGWTLILVGAAALLWRQRFPVPVLLVTAGAALLYYPLGFPDSSIGLSLVVAHYTVARARGWPIAAGAAAVLTVAFATLAQDGVADHLQAAAPVGAILLLAVVLGEVTRSRARQVAQAHERAALAEASRESLAAQRAAEERLRIARELHDVLAHQISLINVQAGAALHTREPELAFQALAAIRTASKDALREVRAVLGVLRQADAADPVQPAPSLAQLAELLQRTEAAGLPVRATVAVEPSQLPAAVDLIAYRIVQEALTNAVRHAAASAAAVEIRRDGDDVIVTVDDDGAGPADAQALRQGTGLRGMAERVVAVGGQVQAAPRPGGGFRVRARLPIGPEQEHPR
ncbi:sensor histidine kinase [Micromonospora sp. KC207]|uniref:sensor histidine kinase n=1 Tax=Micromonospora sp. KC207 TaxID=2530377 RepID=UPI0010532E18|nr:histidine kinase [Micromonospora sp. KC207]TDC61373.1 sensor histidine kinase [Micromonospora sp. KC207]